MNLSIYIFSLLALSSIEAQARVVSVDLQFAICHRKPEDLARRLGFESEPKEVTATYFEAPRAQLSKIGVFLKLKEKKGTYTTEVKIVNGPGLPQPEGLACEIDRYGDERTEKCSLEQKADRPTWTRLQKSLVESKTDIVWKDISSIGSFIEYRWKGAWELDGSLEANMDMLVIPGGPAISEFSIKTTLAAEQETYRKILGWLNRNNAELCPVQEGKIFRILGTHR